MSGLRKRPEIRRRQFERAKIGRGLGLTNETLTMVPADAQLRCLRDQMIVEPLDTVYSTILEVHSDTKPMRGIVRAIGPGCYPKLYDHSDKHKRTKTWDSKRFRPTEIKVGQIVYLGGLENGGYSFETFLWGDKLMLHCTEKDVCGIEN